MMATALLWGVRGGILLLLAMPLVVTPGALYPNLVGKTLYARSLIEIITVLWIGLAVMDRRYRPTRSWVLLAFFAYLMVEVAAGVAGVSPTRSFWSSYERMMGIWGLAHWFALALVLVSVLRSARDWWWMLNGAVASVLLISVVGLLQSWGLDLLPGMRSVDRVTGTLGNPSYFAATLVIGIPFAAGLLVRSLLAPNGGKGSKELDEAGPDEGRFRQSWRVFWAVTVLLGVWALYLSGSRGALLGVAGGAVIMPMAVALRGNRRAVRAVGLTAGGLLLVLSGFFAFDRFVGLSFVAGEGDQVTTARLFVTEPGDGSSGVLGRLSDQMDSRIASAKLGLRSFAERPLLGWGPGNYLPALEHSLGPSDSEFSETFWDQAHNVFVEELTTKGVIGGLSFVGLWGALVWAIMRRKRSSRQEVLAYAILGAFAAQFFHNQFFFDTPTAMLFWTILVAWVAVQEPDAGEVRPLFRGFSLGRLVPVNNLLIRGASGAMVLVALGGSLYLFNYRPFDAARALHPALTAEPVEVADLKLAQRGLNTFPALGNVPRGFLLQRVTNQWQILEPEARLEAISIALREIGRGMDMEPRNSRLLLHSVAFLQTVFNGPETAAVVDPLLDRLTEVAQGRLQTQQSIAIQAVLKGEYEVAVQVSDDYVDRAPWAEEYFADIRRIASGYLTAGK